MIIICKLLKLQVTILKTNNLCTILALFANGPGGWGSILGRVIRKTQKMILDATLINTQHYKVLIKGKVEQSKEWSYTLPNTSV